MPNHSDSDPLKIELADPRNENPFEDLPSRDILTTPSGSVSQHETQDEVLMDSASGRPDVSALSAELRDGSIADPVHTTAAYDEFLRSPARDSASDEDSVTLPENALALRMLHDVLRTGGGEHTIRPDNGDRNRVQGFTAEWTHERPAIGGSLITEVSSVLPRSGLIPARFRVTAMLGKGGFGTVFRATDSLLCREVAIKIPHTEISTSEGFRERFLRESRAASRLNHPSIVRILEVSEQAGNAFQVAEFVDGCRLSERLRTTPAPSFREAAWMTARLADAIHHAHFQGVRHRDIKPDNILLEKLSPGFEYRLPRLTDFGLARIVDDQMLVSRTGILLGTPRYMSPEQLGGDPALHTAATDIYSLGAVLYEMLAGVPPFHEVTTLTRRIVTANDLPKPLQSQRTSIPRDLVSICMKCMAIQPRDGYQSAELLRIDLDRFLDGRPTVARPLPLHEQIWRWAKREKQIASLVSTVLMSALIIAAVLWFSKLESDRKNLQLSAAFSALKIESEESKRLRQSAEKHRAEAEDGRRLFCDLSWRNGIQKAFSSFRQIDLRGSIQTLHDLAESHVDAETRVEWQLLTTELRKHYRTLRNSLASWTEVRRFPEKSWIAAADDHGTIVVYDLGSHQAVAEYATGIRSVYALAVSPDGLRIAAGGSVDDQIRSKVILMDLVGGTLLREIHRMPTTVESLAFSPDGRQIACGCRYKPLSVIDLETGEITKISSVVRNEWLDWNADGSRLAIQTDKATIGLSNYSEGGSVSVPVNTDLPISIRSGCWPGNQNLIGSVFYNGRDIFVIDRQSQAIVSKTRSQVERMNGIYSSPGGREILTTHSDGNIIVWEFRTPQESEQNSGVSRSQSATELSETALEIDPSDVNADRPSGTGTAPDLLEVRAQFKVDNEKINSVCFADEQTVIIASSTGALIQFQIPDQLSDLTEIDGKNTDRCHFGDVCARSGEVCYPARSGEISQVSLNRLLKEQETLSSQFSGIALNAIVDQKPVSTGAPLLDQMRISPSGLLLAASSVDGRLIVLHRKSITVPFREPITTVIPPQISASEVQKDGDITDAIAFSNSEDLIFRIHDSRKLEAVRIGTKPSEPVSLCSLPGPGTTAAVAPDDSFIVVGGSFQGLVTVDPESGSLRKLHHRGDTCGAVLFTSSTEFISGHQDGSLRFWDLNNEGDAITIPAHQNAIQSLEYLKDRKIGFSVDLTGTLVLWRTDPIELIGELTSLGLSTGGVGPRITPCLLTCSPAAAANGLSLGVIADHRPTGLFLQSLSSAALNP